MPATTPETAPANAFGPVHGSRPTALQALAAHPVVVLLALLLGTGAGLLVGQAHPVTTTAAERLAVAGSDVAAQAVPGYALASGELAANYARYVDNSSDQRDLERAVGAPRGSITSVDASPVPESNVVLIEVGSPDPAVATRATAALGQQLTDRVEAASSDKEAVEVLARYTDLSNQVAAAQQDASTTQGLVDAIQAGQTRGDGAVARADAARAAAGLAVLEVQQDALGQRYRDLVDTVSSVRLTVVEPASVVGDDATATLQRYGLAGAVLGALLALVLTLLLEGRRRRRAEGTRDGATFETAAGEEPARPAAPQPLVGAGVATGARAAVRHVDPRS